MKAYFDSNVYGFIDRCSELSAVASFLRQRDVQLLGSDANLMEFGRAPNSETRKRLLGTLTGLVTHRSPPLGFLHAKELTTEVRRWHLEWLRAKPDQAALNQWLNADREHWRTAKREHDLPQVDEYNDLVRAAAGELRRQQRDARKSLGNKVKHRTFTEAQADLVWRLEAKWGLVARSLWAGTGHARLLRLFHGIRGLDADPICGLAEVLGESGGSVPVRATSGNAGDINHVTLRGPFRRLPYCRPRLVRGSPSVRAAPRSPRQAQVCGPTAVSP